MVKVVWGAGLSGYLLAATLKHHLSQVGAESLGGNFYHDDFVISLPDSEAAERLVTSLVSGLQTAGMKLAKWKTNSPDVAALLRELGLDLPDPTDGPAFLKVLGISWSPQQDTLQIALEQVVARAELPACVSKRAITALVASVFDPAGWLAPFLLRGKTLQGIWASDLRWDDPAPAEIVDELRDWARQIAEVREIRLNRAYCERGRSSLAASFTCSAMLSSASTQPLPTSSSCTPMVPCPRHSSSPRLT